jgi:[ribosomal protein S18]-alanine N-acetyltransferase
VTRPSAPAASAPIRIREYRADDFGTLCEIDRACYEPVIAYSRRTMRAYLNQPGADCVVAESRGHIVGFCITVRRLGEGYIVTIDVLEEFRKKRVGTALLAEAERRLAAKGVRAIALDTATDNFSAISFWQNHGYRKIGVRKGYYPNGSDAFAMTKSLVL